MANQNKPPLLSYQPLRFLFQLLYFVTVIPRLPYYLVISLIPSLRPNPKWSAKQTFLTRICIPLLDATSRVGITEALTLESGEQGERFQIVAPSTSDVYKGPLASETIKPATTGGTWFPHAPGTDVTSKTVFFYVHGGAFVQGDGRDARSGAGVKKLLEKGGADIVFSVQYRLSGYGGRDPFPAALQDVLSGYLFLLNKLHIPARQIVLTGDSAGGNLAVALLRYLHEFGDVIDTPTPQCAVLFSPWVAPLDYDMTGNPNCSTDFIPKSFAVWGAHTYSDGLPDAASNPYVTLLGHPFPTPVPIFAHAGAAELFCDRIARWADEMRAVEGNVVEMYQEPDAVHDTFFGGHLLGFEESALDVVARAGEFVEFVRKF